MNGTASPDYQQESQIANAQHMKQKNPKNRGQWIGFFYLTLSDISAAIETFVCLFYVRSEEKK
jgi:hypothetical protein